MEDRKQTANAVASKAALDLYIHPCIRTPQHPLHPPPAQLPLRIEIQGPLESIQKLLPHASWQTTFRNRPFLQPAGLELAELTYRKLYGQGPRLAMEDDMVVRNEYLGWIGEKTMPLEKIDYYGVVFDHLVPADDPNPEVLCINIIEMDNDGGEFARKYLPLTVNPAEYTGKKVLAVPRCCQHKKGSLDRRRVNDGVAAKNQELQRRLQGTWPDRIASKVEQK